MSDKLYDLIIDDQFAVIYGASTVVFIKTGRGGSCYGYNNKYMYIARTINQITGFTVVISANNTDVPRHFKKEFDWFESSGIACEDIIYIGISNGAYLGARYGYQVSEISRMLLINAPLMINWSHMAKGLENFCGKSVTMVYGDKDPSFGYYDILQVIKNPVFFSKIINGADHVFLGLEDEFNELIINFCKSVKKEKSIALE